MIITDELWTALGFEKYEKYKLVKWKNKKYNLLFEDDTRLEGRERCDIPKSAEELFEILEKEISKKSFNEGRSYVQNGLMDLLGVKYEIDKVKRCL